jgi:hypothetical protein
MRTILSCLALTIIFCTDANGQIMIDAKRPDIIFSSSTISESGRVRLATLLQDSSVREEIQLLDSQKAELDKLTLAIGLANKAASDEYLESSRNLETPEEKRKAREDFQAFTDGTQSKFEAEASKHLLQNQITRLKQIAVTRQLESIGIDGVFSKKSPIGSALQLSSDQQKNLNAKIAEVRAKLEKKIAALKLETVQEILQELPTDKQQVFRERFGIEF